jgi:hypothetical protein
MSEPKPDAPTTIGSYRLGRFFCARCNTVATVVCDWETTIICCPTCGDVATAGSHEDRT